MSRSDSSVRVLLRLPAFRRMWAAISVSSFGDWLGLLATTALAAYLTKNSSSLIQGAAISGVLLTRLAPDLLLSPFAGALVDRFDRRWVAVICDLTAGSLYASIAIVGDLRWLLIAQFLAEAVGLFSTPAKQAIWVNIVPRERLAVANQLNYVSMYGMVPVAALAFAGLSTAANFFGAAAVSGSDEPTALIVGSTSAVAIDIALFVDAVTYALAATIIAVSRKIIPAFSGDQERSKSLFSLVGEGISYISRDRVMRAIYIGILGAFAAGGLVAGVAQAYVATLGAGNAGYGILFGTVFTGLALGMLIGPRVLPSVSRRIVFCAAIGASGAALIVMAAVPDFVGAAIISMVMGLFAGVAWITGFTMIGHEVADRLRGRVFAFVMSSVRITLFVTIAVAPLMAGGLGRHHLTIGKFTWVITAPAIVLAMGGVGALAVAMIAAHQIGDGGVRLTLRRVLRRWSRGLFAGPTPREGLLITVEGPQPALVGWYRIAVEQYLRSAQIRAVQLGSLAAPDDGISAGPSTVPRDQPVPDSQRQSPVPEVADSGAIEPAAAGSGHESSAAGSSHGPAAAGSGHETDAAPAPALAGAKLAHSPAGLVAAAEHAAAEQLRPALELGSAVICSGYLDSYVVRANQSGVADDQLVPTLIWAARGLQPDLTVIVLAQDTDPQLETLWSSQVGTFSGRSIVTTGVAGVDISDAVARELDRIVQHIQKRTSAPHTSHAPDESHAPDDDADNDADDSLPERTTVNDAPDESEDH